MNFSEPNNIVLILAFHFVTTSDDYPERLKTSRHLESRVSQALKLAMVLGSSAKPLCHIAPFFHGR